MDDVFFAAYAPGHDMSFIMQEVYNDNGVVSTQCIGWYYGEPNDLHNEMFAGKLRAEY